ncbi:MAG: hypothetical protein OEY49_19625 [Candidatus Heimdallarchaeota archaeon]|nr:hypothetical protein [Candidatus Heimdallarchaeota archaeon]
MTDASFSEKLTEVELSRLEDLDLGEEDKVDELILNSLKKRIKLVEDNIILFRVHYKKLKIINNIMLMEMDFQTKHLNEYYLVLYAPDGEEKGTSEYREWGINQLNSREKIKHISFAIDKNSLLRLVIKFVMAKVVKIPYSVHNNIDEALKKIREIRT